MYGPELHGVYLRCFDANFHPGCSQLFKELSTEPLDAKFPDHVIRLSSDDWLYPLLAHNPHYHDRLARLFPQCRAFAHIAAFLLPLAPALQAKMDTVKRHMLGRNTIGMHLRLQKVRAFTFCWGTMATIFSSALRGTVGDSWQMMPDNLGKKTLRAPSPDIFFKVARMLQRERGMPDNTTMFYLSTDSGYAVTAARGWFAQRNLTVVLFDDFYQVGLCPSLCAAQLHDTCRCRRITTCPHILPTDTACGPQGCRARITGVAAERYRGDADSVRDGRVGGHARE
jgi:hypothetical protein